MPKLLEFDGNLFDPETGTIQLRKQLRRQEARILAHVLRNGPVTAKELAKAGIGCSEGSIRTAVRDLNATLGWDRNRMKYIHQEGEQPYHCSYSCHERDSWEFPTVPNEFRVLPQPTKLLATAHILSYLGADGGTVEAIEHKLENGELVQLVPYDGDSSILRVKFGHRSCEKDATAEGPSWNLFVGFRRDGEGRWRSINLQNFSHLKFEAKMERSSSQRPYIRLRVEDSQFSPSMANRHLSTNWVNRFVNNDRFHTITIPFTEWNRNIWPANDGLSIDWGKILHIVIGHDKDDGAIDGELLLQNIRFVSGNDPYKD